MDFYNVYFAALVLFVLALWYHQHQQEKQVTKQESLALPAGDGNAAARKFKWEYLGVYAWVVAADWLQVFQTWRWDF